MRISDWSSDVCSSDLCRKRVAPVGSSALRRRAPQAHDQTWKISPRHWRPPQRMAEMMADRSNHIRASNRVDWDDPKLQKLPTKIEGWDLDNRENHPREEVDRKSDV